MAYAIDVTRLLTASSLSALIDARARLAADELAALEDRRAALLVDRDSVNAEVTAYIAALDHRSQSRDRLHRDALRVVGTGGAIPRDLSDTERDAVAEELAFATALADRERQLTSDVDALASIEESVTAKHTEIERLARRAQTLTSARDIGAAQVDVLRGLADDANAAAAAIAELTRGATSTDSPVSWVWPVTGVVTQTFGPSTLGLEPAVTYRGVTFPHFHDAVDIGAPLGTPVIAVAAGRVTFVGHLPDGAMVVVVAHDDGLVTLSAHLDDAFAPPTVKAGERVSAGQRIGTVGMTGVTTGPHLHFSVHDANGPVDPIVILSTRP